MSQQTLSEPESLMAWLDCRIDGCTNTATFLFYQRKFKDMWVGLFGNLDDIPQGYKDKVALQYAKLLLWGSNAKAEGAQSTESA